VSGQCQTILFFRLRNVCLVPGELEAVWASSLMQILYNKRNVLNPYQASSHDFLVPQSLVTLVTELTQLVGTGHWIGWANCLRRTKKKMGGCAEGYITGHRNTRMEEMGWGNSRMEAQFDGAQGCSTIHGIAWLLMYISVIIMFGFVNYAKFIELQLMLTIKVDATISININFFDHIFNWGK